MKRYLPVIFLVVILFVAVFGVLFLDIEIGSNPTSPVVKSNIKDLKNKNKSTRMHAIDVLLDYGDKSAISPLTKVLLGDDDYEVRKYSAFALGVFGSNRASSALSDAMLEDSYEAVRKECAIALGKIRDKGSIPALKQALKDNSGGVRSSASSALNRF